MASPSAPDHPPVPPAAFRDLNFAPGECVPPVASIPMDFLSVLPSSRSHCTRSRTAASRATTSLAPASVDSARTQGVDARSKKLQCRDVHPGTSSKPSTPSPKKRAREVSLKKAPPSAEDYEDERKQAATESCCICMSEVNGDDLAIINGCDHKFCFECIETWAERENSCPLCKLRFTKIDRVNKKTRRGQKNVKRVKQRDQRSDLATGVALEGLLGKYTYTKKPKLECSRLERRTHDKPTTCMQLHLPTEQEVLQVLPI